MSGLADIAEARPVDRPRFDLTYAETDDVLFYAFRYALGRKSYAVGTVADALIKSAGALRTPTRALIIAEIEARPDLGKGLDAKRWREVLAALAKPQHLNADPTPTLKTETREKGD